MDTAVAIIIFNRPDKTYRLFQVLARRRPKRLFIIADGPRGNVPADKEQCAKTRAVFDKIPWECEVKRNYSDTNLGCGPRISSGITWVFEHVDRAVIIEDDCLPHASFFPFCEELLEKYKEDERIMHISGRKACSTLQRSDFDYYFCRQLSCLGWATWARAWEKFDLELSDWPRLRNTTWLLEILSGHRKMERFLKESFDNAYSLRNNPPYWGPQWTYSVWANNGLAIRPYINLVEYIGFEDGSFWARPKDFDFPAETMQFPIRHPADMTPDRKADLMGYDAILVSRFKRSLQGILTLKGMDEALRSFYRSFLRKVRIAISLVPFT